MDLAVTASQQQGPGPKPVAPQQQALARRLVEQLPPSRALLSSVFVSRCQLEGGLEAVERLLLGECLVLDLDVRCPACCGHALGLFGAACLPAPHAPSRSFCPSAWQSATPG